VGMAAGGPDGTSVPADVAIGLADEECEASVLPCTDIFLSSYTVPAIVVAELRECWISFTPSKLSPPTLALLPCLTSPPLPSFSPDRRGIKTKSFSRFFPLSTSTHFSSLHPSSPHSHPLPPSPNHLLTLCLGHFANVAHRPTARKTMMTTMMMPMYLCGPAWVAQYGETAGSSLGWYPSLGAVSVLDAPQHILVPAAEGGRGGKDRSCCELKVVVRKVPTKGSKEGGEKASWRAGEALQAVQKEWKGGEDRSGGWQVGLS
jgi:hypothetical protein